MAFELSSIKAMKAIRPAVQPGIRKYSEKYTELNMQMNRFKCQNGGARNAHECETEIHLHRKAIALKAPYL